MTPSDPSGLTTEQSPARRVVAVGGLWMAAAIAVSLSGVLAPPQGAPPLRLFAAAGLPVLVFVLWYRSSTAFRRWILDLDLRLIVMLQAWRVIGGVFLVLLAFGLLPALFAWPAGLGDIAIGLTAPLVALALWRRPAWATGRGFLAWNLLGLHDFGVAIATGTLASGLFPGLVQGATAGAMNVWPLSIIPGFLVPFFAILHLVAILQARARAA
ncbi:MAG: hypothetical protein JSU82_02165 [Rhodospirillales bacterium]|nr:MAG: hypothetical protein JSU82_02165 [Rhodospirillales bacterium]